MAKILSIETSTQTCSVCVSEGEKVLSIHSFSDHFSHTEIITKLIRECLAEAKVKISELQAIAISKGPGSYTALRVGTSTAKGLCFGLDIPLIEIDTLKSLALASQNTVEGPNNLYVPCIDARRMEVFTSFWDQNMAEIKAMHPLILDLTTFQDYENHNKIVFSGDSNEKMKTLYGHLDLFHFSDIQPSSAHLVPLAHTKFMKKDFVDVAAFTPVYAKAPNITTPKKVI